MAVERLPRPITFMFRIKMQHQSCGFAPVRGLVESDTQPEQFIKAHGRPAQRSWIVLGSVHA
ncbi:hypothetical protein CQ12_41045 [Bradyrhizobium jicamae]|uniref:Uncharacterized protein n=1 Tax=Bradyrhizobium jicamae TaxID=280332 RepID=A0A0R3M1Z8_9BRAD|nr:hypothetical protein CQ12_41045 [Bradyrhizobium jicamae]